MNQTQLLAALAALLSKGQTKAPTKTAKRSKAKSGRMDKEAYEASIIKGLNAKGIQTKDIELRVNVLPYKGWTERGRIVSKGQHGVRGLFHVSQTEPLAPTAEGQLAQVTVLAPLPVAPQTKANVLTFDKTGQVSAEAVAAFKAAQAKLDAEYGPRA